MSRILLGNKKGYLLLEVLAVSSIIGIVMAGLLSLAFLSLKLSSSSKKTITANYLAQETMEAVRSFKKNTDWNPAGLGSLSSGLDYHMEIISSEWEAVSGSETSGIFERSFQVENVSRNPLTGNIEESYNPANNDSETKKIIVAVLWESREVELESYFTNWEP
ncbi:MAG: hypothetical protein A2365_02690 [Candidatus Nealsonbacteria bacterium RIFOXYB1_FULL_40_15]|uniref:Type II secretion system protein GspI C-terminal domain-containing protein n=2 Tax=Candidatus Nealsoniibacteriota TaxID=1817911 RepID=A0A1G2ENX7_9BACT|nr:MAG: hypothetical protein A2365_02690 [Candidatus Nealsonbacteria bacterium RIFOXYB1_FULL_40_15]OGZ27505.1 MAG: hypothetical protein A2427_01545 [Candidatus Nealsonbacteria bacterium RIFOXYC1_FULL_40_7]OGZ28161.1 MAG: hypothetical protein A2562_02950 [Candidatus Nealsonbacteria bacterium RIFOXYD1_FULL_39_11]